MNQLSEIRKILKSKANSKAKTSTKKFVPTVKKSYGVRVPILNIIAKQFKHGGIKLVKELWQSGIYEEQLIGAKILGKIFALEPQKCFKFIEKQSNKISDWAVCDTLGTQGIKNIIKTRQKEIFELSEKLVVLQNPWQKRLGLVLLINFTKNKKLRKNIEEIMKKAENNKEYYVKKAIIWLKDRLRKNGANIKTK